MTLDEAMQVIAVLEEHGCPCMVCAQTFAVALQAAFPSLSWWHELVDDGKNCEGRILVAERGNDDAQG